MSTPQAVITGEVKRPLPAVRRDPGAALKFGDLRGEMFNEQGRHEIWRDDLAKRGHPDLAAERQRLADIYAAVVKLIDRAMTDPVIHARLKDLAREEKAAAEPDAEGQE